MPRHAETRIVPYAPEDIYQLVADIRSYPEFLPWCRAARMRAQTDTLLVAELVIGFRGLTERFTSRVSLDASLLEIRTTYEDGPFRYLNNHWKFLPNSDGEGCVIDFYVDFEFRSRLLQTLIGAFFTEAVRRMVEAFEARADALYGPKS